MKKSPQYSDFENRWGNSPTCTKFYSHKKVVLHFCILILLLPNTLPLTYPNINKFKDQKLRHFTFTAGRSWIMIFFRIWSKSSWSCDPGSWKVMIRIKNWSIFFWSGSKIGRFFFDPDQKMTQIFLIRIKNLPIFFWSGSKIGWFFFDPDQKLTDFFLIRIKNLPIFFWSGSKNCPIFFDPDQKLPDFFLIRIKNCPNFFWSGSKIARFFFDPDQKSMWFFLIRIKNLRLFFLLFLDPKREQVFFRILF